MIRPVTNQAEVEALAITCGLSGYFDDTGEEDLERANAIGWGEPLRGESLM